MQWTRVLLSQVNQLHRNYFDKQAARLGIQKQEDWYRVKYDELWSHGASTVLPSYSYSLHKALSAVYPEFEWNVWTFERVPNGYWNNPKHRRTFFDYIAECCGIVQQQDWYWKVKRSQIKKLGGAGLLNNYRGSELIALSDVYPEYQWYFWLYDTVPKHFWRDVNNRKKYFDWLGEELGVSCERDWYRVRLYDIHSRGGSAVLALHKGSLSSALYDVYPNTPSEIWKYLHVPSGHWTVSENHKKYFDWLGKQLGIKEMDDWYKVQIEDVIKWGGRELTNLYGYSFIKAITSVYSNHEWHIWKFVSVPDGFWDDENNQNDYFRWLRNQLNINSPADFSSITAEKLLSLKAGALIKRFGGVSKLLSKVYPDFELEHAQQPWSLQKKQNSLAGVISQAIFHGRAA